MTRIPAAVVLALALLCSACSSGGSSTPTTATGTAAAKAINLKKADLPSSWTSEPASNPAGKPREAVNSKLATCMGLPAADAKDVVDLSSDSFSFGTTSQSTQVSSEVEVVASEAQADRLRKAFAGDKAEGCLTTVLESNAGSTPGLTYGTPTVTRKAEPSGVSGGYAFDIIIPLTTQGVTVNAFFAVVGFFVKHTEVTLQTTVLGTPAADYDQDSLVAKLVERAKTSAV